jgi:tetratricopeptide (TPR) repeat protein
MRAFFTLIVALLLGGATAGTAVALPQAAAAVAPADPSAAYYFILGRHLEDERKVDEAIAAHKKAIALAPDSAEVRAELAALYARQDRAREALETAESALQRDPDNREANRIIGTVYAALSEQRQPFRTGDDPKQYSARAIAALQKSRREAGFDINLELLLGRLHLGAGEYDKAIASLRRVVDDQPAYPEAAMLLASAQDGAGLKEDEIRTLETALEYSPGFYRGHLRLAELYEQSRRFADAAAAYGLAAAANPRIDASSRHAAALLNAGKAAAARDILQAAIQKKTAPDASLLYMLGQAQRLLKEQDAAAATVQKLKAAFPEDARGLYLGAQLLRDAGRFPEAIAMFQDLMTRSPDDESLVYEYVSVLEKAGRIDDAERVLRDVLAKDPLDANALNSLGYLLADHGRQLDEAVDLVQRALKIEPANAAFLDSLGWAYYRQGKLDLADAPLTRAAEQMPASSTINDHLGDLRLRQQRFTEAVAAFERSLAGDGDSIDRSKIEKKVRDARARVRR